MKLKIVFDDNLTKELTYTGDWTFSQWTQYFFSARYYVINKTNEIGNLCVDTEKVKYIEIVK
jgi:hypothetical protein